VLLTVDDDPGVSRAVARDLRRRYGDRYRVVRASSGEEALDALRELKLRGDLVAALLADYRMPQMNGIEFLEQAMDLFPRARRALLTAYADTDAAIQAINLVDVDHYLLKPWEPPEEKLYPVVDAMVETWLASPDAVVQDVRIVGHHWSAPSFAARDFLARNAVPYRWYAADEPEGRRLLAAAGAGPDDVPLVVPPDGEPLRAPTEAQLAAAVGLTVEPSADFYDLVVVGGGPAGLGAAVYGASEGRVVKDYDRALPLVPAYAAELNQVWTNLIDNALDAMDGSGTLTLRTSVQGDSAVVEVGDTGPGIPEDVRRRVFEPFFTTKPVGQGTGLGLDVAWRIVTTRHGGVLKVRSEPGDTRFVVRLPLSETPPGG
jgi:CheY-like chemotaxis protein